MTGDHFPALSTHIPAGRYAFPVNPDPPGLDLIRLAGHLRRAGLTRGPLTAELIVGGKSNLTYVVGDGEST